MQPRRSPRTPDLADLAKANKLKAPKYAIKPGQSLKLEGCKE